MVNTETDSCRLIGNHFAALGDLSQKNYVRLSEWTRMAALRKRLVRIDVSGSEPVVHGSVRG
jgi:hypothetical protein